MSDRVGQSRCASPPRRRWVLEGIRCLGGGLCLPLVACTPSIRDADLDGVTVSEGDCNDSDAYVYPGSTHSECVSGRDQDCDGVVGTLVPDGAEIVSAIGSSTLTLHVTLAGQPIDDTNTSATDNGRLELEDVATGRHVAVASTWDAVAGQAVADFRVPVFPGIYHLNYTVGEDGPQWPDNHRARLMSQIDLREALELTVDVPRIPVAISLTLDGAPISAANTRADDEGAIDAVDAVTGERFRLFSSWNDARGVAVGRWESYLVSGAYDLYYAVVSGTELWPLNPSSRLKEGWVVAGPDELELNLETAVITPVWTLNGAPVSGENSSAQDEGALLLKHEDGDTFQVSTAWDDGLNQPMASAFRILAGRYSSYYQVQDGGTFWPRNDRTLLETGLTLAQSQALTVDIQAVPLSVSVTLNGEPSSSSNGGPGDEGELLLRDRRTGGTFPVMTTWDDSAGLPRSEANISVIPGDYDLLYSARGDGTHWPLNEKVLLRDSLTLNAAEEVGIDIPTSRLSLNLSLEGQAVDATNTTAALYGQFSLESVSGGGDFDLPPAWNVGQASVVNPIEASVLAGRYSLRYVGAPPGGAWPLGEAVLVDEMTVPGTGLEQDINLSGMPHLLKLARDGEDGAGGSTPISYGTLVVKTLESDQELGHIDSWDSSSSSVVAERLLKLLPGHYALYYRSSDPMGIWPLANEGRAGCYYVP